MQEPKGPSLPIVVLAGGLGTRLKEVAGNLPKALVPLCGEPFLFWKLRQLEHFGAKQIFLLAGKGAVAVTDFLNTYHSLTDDLSIEIIDEGPNPLGTGGALINSAHLLPDKFILTYGDNLLNEDFNCLNSFEGLAIMVTAKKLKRDTNNIQIDSGTVVSYSKENPSAATYMDYGYLSFTKKVLEINIELPVDLSEIICQQISGNNLSYFETEMPYFEIGTPEALVETEKALRLGLIRGLSGEG